MIERSSPNQSPGNRSTDVTDSTDDARDVLRQMSMTLADDLRTAVISGDNSMLSVSTDRLASHPEYFAQATPRLLTFLCGAEDSLQSVVGELLGRRAHWPGTEQLNDLVLPCVRHISSQPRTRGMMNSLVHGLFLNAPEIDSRHIDALSNLALEQYSRDGKPTMHIALLSLLGEELRTTDLNLTLRAGKFMLEQLNRHLGEGVTFEEKFGANYELLLRSTIAGMFSMRHIFRILYPIAGEPGESVRGIIDEMREFTRITADRIEQGIVPESPSDWLLLLTYPRIDPEIHIPSQMAARAVIRELEDSSPELAELVEEAFNPVIENHSGFHALPGHETDPIVGLSVITMLTSYTCQIEQKAPPADTIHKDLLELDKLAHSTTVPLVSFYAQEARSRLLKTQGEPESNMK